MVMMATLTPPPLYRFFDTNRTAQKNPLQALVEKHRLKIKVDEKIQQAYSNGWMKHSAWYVNGDGKPKMAKTNHEYKGGEYDHSTPCTVAATYVMRSQLSEL